MRILLKIVLFPIIAILFVGSLCLRFITGISGALLNIVGGLIFALTVIGLVMSYATWQQAIPLFVIAFLCSEFGIYSFANFLLDRIDGVTARLMAI